MDRFFFERSEAPTITEHDMHAVEMVPLTIAQAIALIDRLGQPTRRDQGIHTWDGFVGIKGGVTMRRPLMLSVGPTGVAVLSWIPRGLPRLMPLAIDKMEAAATMVIAEILPMRPC